MADVASALRSWSVTANSNSPNTNTVVGAGLAPNLQQIQATVRQYLASIGTSVVGAATTDLSNVDGFTIPISGNATVTSFGTEQAGIGYRLQFSGTPTLKQSTAIQTPGSADMSLVAGDIVEVVSLGSGNWKVVADEAQNKRFSTLYAGSLFAGALNASTSGSVTGTLTATKFLGNANGSFSSALANGGTQSYGDSILGAVHSGAGSTNDLTFLNKNSSVVAQVPTGTQVFSAPQMFALGAASVFNGVGIAFPVAQSASTDANTLDDYEEGTWTPSVGGTATYTLQNGKYLKIGRLCFISCKLTINVIGTGSTVAISGLPFTAQNDADSPATIAINQWTNLASTFVYLVGLIAQNATTITFQGIGAAAATLTTPINTLASTATISLSGCYMTV